MNASFFHDMLGSVAERGRSLLERAASRPDAPIGAKAPETLEALCRSLLSRRGEASGVALAPAVARSLCQRADAGRIEFFRLLAQAFDPDLVTIAAPGTTIARRPRRPTCRACWRRWSRPGRS